MKTFAYSAALLAVGMTFVMSTATAGAFDASLASCARTVEFCDKLSYDKDLCKQAREKLPDCDENTGSGVLCRLKLKDVAPTQVSVGAQATHCKAKAKFKTDSPQNFAPHDGGAICRLDDGTLSYPAQLALPAPAGDGGMP